MKNAFRAIGHFFRFIGTDIKKGLTSAVVRGLTAEVMTLAVGYVRNAAESNVNDAQKREIVVRLLVARGVPESIARLAVELAYQLVKHELGDK